MHIDICIKMANGPHERNVSGRSLEYSPGIIMGPAKVIICDTKERVNVNKWRLRCRREGSCLPAEGLTYSLLIPESSQAVSQLRISLISVLMTASYSCVKYWGQLRRFEQLL